MAEHRAEGARIQRIVFLILFAALFLLVGRLFSPFLSVLVWSAVAYGIVQPLYRRAATLPSGAERPLWLRSGLAAAFALGTLLLVAAPLALVAVVLLVQVRELTGYLSEALSRGTDWLSGPRLAELAERVSGLTGGAVDLSSLDLKAELGRVLQSLGNQAVSLSAGLLRNALSLVLAFAFFTFTLYFLLVDGRQLLLVIVDAIPLRNADTVAFMRKFRDTGRDLVVGYLLVALFQGAVAFVIYLAMGVPGPLPLGVLTAIASFIPIVGTGLVWLPVGIGRLASGQLGSGILLIALCAVFVSMLDNLIRPLLLQSRIKMHPLLIFFSIVGGLRLFGFDGLILGPLVLVLFFAGVDMYARAYGRTRRRDGEGAEAGDGDGNGGGDGRATPGAEAEGGGERDPKA